MFHCALLIYQSEPHLEMFQQQMSHASDFQQCGIYNQQSLRSACAYTLSDQSLCYSLEYSMTVKLLTKHRLEFLSLKEGSTGSSTLVKKQHCWKSRVTAQMLNSPMRKSHQHTNNLTK